MPVVHLLNTDPEFPSFPHEVSQEQQQAGVVIGGAVVCGTVLLAAITLLVVFFFSEESGEEKKLELYRDSSVLGGSAEGFPNCHDSRMKAYCTGLIEDPERCGCNEQTYFYEYGSEVEVSVDMVPQMDGSVISKEEWYV